METIIAVFLPIIIGLLYSIMDTLVDFHLDYRRVNGLDKSEED